MNEPRLAFYHLECAEAFRSLIKYKRTCNYKAFCISVVVVVVVVILAGWDIGFATNVLNGPIQIWISYSLWQRNEKIFNSTWWTNFKLTILAKYISMFRLPIGRNLFGKHFSIQMIFSISLTTQNDKTTQKTFRL